MNIPADLSTQDIEDLLTKLQNRFLAHPERHPNIQWEEVQRKLLANKGSLRSLWAMKTSGGEPDVLEYDSAKDAYLFVDCSPESPAGRRSLCYDRAGLESRKDARPETSAMDMATEMGIEILNEGLYRKLQATGHYDTKTSSWILTPPEIRKLGGALFMEYRYGTVFVYHNGAQSYYAARGFRGSVYIGAMK
ncbi:DUF4256 domain-containing protein [Gracilinema caldarium]|uniref:DUF4256 domain-containing protein n=1 Tax=Gracilinema caldarium TaxID=215591 RepID=UPI0026EE9443|nr:DUF4256 domain-containing protein [Gracilinema caldarium]